jgi:amidase
VDLDVFSPAKVMMHALAERQVSAVELLDLHLRRIEQYNGALNAIIAPDYDRARLAAVEADKARMSGQDGVLLGLPLTIKDSIDITGMRTICGIEERTTQPPAAADARTVARLREAGAVIMGKTNTPSYTGDWQTDNPVFGRTNNPWDLSRTSGGSSGGAAAAVAAALSPLDIGSDIAGSIRVPASHCGVFGHRPSDTAVPRSGHYPGWTLPNAAMIMNVLGPLARSADDLDLALTVIAGPDVGEDAAWSLQLPPPRHTSLADFRVAILPRFDWLPVDDAVLAGLDEALKALQRAGVHVGTAQPEGFGDLRDYMFLYNSLLALMFSREEPRDERLQEVERLLASGADPVFDPGQAHGLDLDAAGYLDGHRRREEYRASYRTFFEDWDILLAPITLSPASPHNAAPAPERRLVVNGEAVSYMLQMVYPGVATLTGQPATAFPVGQSRDGLPVGLQAIGPYLEDRTAICFARLLTQEVGGFRVPPRYTTD